jgi:hypothetical protein
MHEKSLLTKLAETLDQHRAERKVVFAHLPASSPTVHPRHYLSRWLPTPGNVLFTLLVIGSLLWAQNAGAISLGVPTAATSISGIPYQGRLADKNGAPLTQTVNMIFRLYAAASGGTPLWEEQWTGSNSVQVSDGLFNVMLGSLTPISQAVITGNSNLFLGITVGTDSEMSPRVQLGSVPFATQALTVPDGSITTGKIADGAVTSIKLAGGLTAQNVSFTQKSVQLSHFSTSSETFVDIPGSEISVTVSKSALLQISFTGSIFTLMQSNSAAGALLTIAVDGIDRTDLVNQDLFAWSGNCCAPNPAIAPAGFTVFVPVETGTHTVKLRVLALSYNAAYRHAGIGYNNKNSTLSVMVLGS